MSLVGMIVYAATLNLGHLWVVFITAGALGYSFIHSFFLFGIEVILLKDLFIFNVFPHVYDTQIIIHLIISAKGQKTEMIGV